MKKQATQLLLGAMITGLIGSGAMIATSSVAQADDAANHADHAKKKDKKKKKAAAKDAASCGGKDGCKGHAEKPAATEEAKPAEGAPQQ
jgi:hypothetical protein